MRFKAILLPHQIQTLRDVIQAFVKMSKLSDRISNATVDMKLCVEEVVLKFHGESKDDTYVFARFSPDIFSQNMIIESKNNNRIGLTADVENLSNALRAAVHGENTILKLSKRQGQGVLSFEITLPPMGESSAITVVTQDCPIIVLSPAASDSIYMPSSGGKMHWTIELPPAKVLRQVIERMRQVGAEKVAVKVNEDGQIAELRLRCNTDMVSVDTRFERCKVFEWSDPSLPPEENENDGIGKVGDLFFRIRPLMNALQAAACIPSDFIVGMLMKELILAICVSIPRLDSSTLMILLNPTLDSSNGL